MFFNSDNTMSFSLSGDGTYTSSTYPDDTGVWVHWAFVYDKANNAMSILRNGVVQGLEGTPGGSPNGGTASGPTTATGPIYLGVAKGTTGYNPFNGNLDELRVYADRALTEAEVSLRMTNPITDDPGLVLSMTFDGCRGIGDATSVTGVVSVTGKECGAEDNSGAATCSG